ncbi:hypothetical protein QBC38DRAFT_529635 [Podospora fimiseda]|uniref:ABM domain-containing protein n=1 Tax=Podospora fimiseda TaxID=252190 RepID=A0AAN7BN46_9PEZI|nr:hypothetical protein QBC38DRAFT_529635 [Podospora fimiseda]
MALHFLAILEPKPDRITRVCLPQSDSSVGLAENLYQVQEICKSVADYVRENEPGVLKYQWFLSGTTENPKIYVWEIYADQAAVDTHKTSSKMAELVEISTRENNFISEIQVIPLEHFAGWSGQE